MFKSILPEHIREQLRVVQEYEADRAAQFASLSDKDLALSASFWLQHCDTPKRYEPGAPVYDATFWHIIVPEMIKRLKS